MVSEVAVVLGAVLQLSGLTIGVWQVLGAASQLKLHEGRSEELEGFADRNPPVGPGGRDVYALLAFQEVPELHRALAEVWRSRRRPALAAAVLVGLGIAVVAAPSAWSLIRAVTVP